MRDRVMQHHNITIEIGWLVWLVELDEQGTVNTSAIHTLSMKGSCHGVDVSYGICGSRGVLVEIHTNRYSLCVKQTSLL